jgi:hypothetical protein
MKGNKSRIPAGRDGGRNCLQEVVREMVSLRK